MNHRPDEGRGGVFRSFAVGKIDGGMLAATINLDFEREAIPFVQAAHAAAFNRRNVHERIGLSVIALDEAKALHCVEELDRPGRFFTSQGTLRRAIGTTGTAITATSWATTRGSITVARRTAISDGHRLAVDLQLGCRNTATAINESEAHRLPFRETGKTGLFDRRDVDEHVFAAVIANNKAEAFLCVEEFDDARAFADDLCRHAAARCAAATGKAAAAASTAAATESAAASTAAVTAAAVKAAAAAEAITAATATSAATVSAAAAAEVVITELIASAPAAIAAASLVETHA